VSEPPDPGGAPARTVFFGSGQFALPILEALVTAPEVRIVGIVTAPDRPAGRGGDVRPVPVAQRAASLGLPILQPARLRHPEAVAAIAALGPVLGVLADYGQIVPPDVLRIPRHGILNVHPSLLPRHRGATPIPATILAGDNEAGVTVFRMDEGLDTGPLVAATSWPLAGTETTPGLEAEAAARGAGLMAGILPRWLGGELEPQPQDDEGATLTRPLRREDGRLDPHRSAVELERRVRALQPWPGSFLETALGRLIVWDAVPGGAGEEQPLPRATGTLGAPGLAVSDGWLVLREVQPAGGRRMSWESLLRGRPALLGSSVVA
jgi:methionyl-tRNA formyltransferase